MIIPVRVPYLPGAGEIGGAERDLLVLQKMVGRTKREPCLACPEGGALAVEALAMGVPVDTLQRTYEELDGCVR